MNRINRRTSLALAASLLLGATPAMAGEIEVLHRWAAGGEAKAAAARKVGNAIEGHTCANSCRSAGGR